MEYVLSTGGAFAYQEPGHVLMLGVYAGCLSWMQTLGLMLDPDDISVVCQCWTLVPDATAEC